MIKTSVITGKQNTSNKGIEFTHIINDCEDLSKDLEFVIDNSPCLNPYNFQNLQLISKGDSFDVIAAWQDGDDPEDVRVFFGRWNDGFVK